MSNVDDVDKYIALCSDFLIKMKTDRDGESYYFRANKINYEGNKLKFKLDKDGGGEDITSYRIIDLKVDFGLDLKKIKKVIIPIHKDMYKDVNPKSVDCDADKCGGEKEEETALTSMDSADFKDVEGEELVGGRKKKKRRKKRSRSKKRRNKRKNRTKKN